jgi:hypothetical protein
MNAAEVGWRMRQAIASRLERHGIGLAGQGREESGTYGSSWVPVLPTEVASGRYIEAAERTIAGKWNLFALHECDLGFPPRWNQDPKTRVTVPLQFGKDIDYRNEKIVGDIKYLWELNRHLELVTLAQAWHLTREPRFAKAAGEFLISWFEQCPYPRGPNWTSSLELALRLMNWACAWHLLGGENSLLFAADEGQVLRRRWLTSIYQHCHFIDGYLSRYSSANNHLFAELTGLFIATLTWPLWSESARWRERTLSEIEAESIKQNASDGVNREQAFWYHHEVADMMLLCLLFGRANGVRFSNQFRARLESMLEFIASIMNVSGRVPAVGDSDDAVMVRFSQEPGFDPYSSLLATGAVLFERGDLKARVARIDDKTRWLLGDAAATHFDRLSDSAPSVSRREFPEGGYYILGRDLGGPEEVKAVVDAGPLGYLSIAAHGHADALAFTMSVNGHEILVDPGTYAYHCESRWRDYFRGTSAHNTLRVDGEEQSVPGGNFMWFKHAQARCELFEVGMDKDVFEGVHDGYCRLNDPVIHRRRIEFDKAAMRLDIADYVECGQEHSVEIHWHFSERCNVRTAGHTVEVGCAGVRLNIECPPELAAPKIAIGQDDPPLGWRSRQFDHKAPSPVVVCAGRVVGNTKLVTHIAVSAGHHRAPRLIQ